MHSQTWCLGLIYFFEPRHENQNKSTPHDSAFSPKFSLVFQKEMNEYMAILNNNLKFEPVDDFVLASTDKA